MNVKMMLASLAGQSPTSHVTSGGRTTASQFSLSLAGAANQATADKASIQPSPSERHPLPAGQASRDALLQRLAWHASKQGVTDSDLPAGLPSSQGQAAMGSLPPDMDSLPLEALLERADWASNLERLAEWELPDSKGKEVDSLLREAMLERLAQQRSSIDMANRDLPEGDTPEGSLPLEAIIERLALIQGMQDTPQPLAQPSRPAHSALANNLNDEENDRPADNRMSESETEAFVTVPLMPVPQEGQQAAGVVSQPERTTRDGLSAQWASLRDDAPRGQGQSAIPVTADNPPRQGFFSQLDARGEFPNRSLEFSTSTSSTVIATSGPSVPTAEASRPAMANPDTSPLTSTTPGSGSTAAPQPAAAQSTLSSPLQSQAWPNQLGQQLVQFARLGGEQRIEMQLHPAELGPLSVTLKMTEQGAQAQFLSAHAQVRQVLEQAIPQLRDALAEQGIELSDTSVGEQRQQDTQAFAEGNGQGSQAGRNGEDPDGTLADVDGLEGQAANTGISLDGRVNLYA